MKKIYSLLTALLVAGSMMATIESVDFSQQGYKDQEEVDGYLSSPVFISLNPNSPGKPAYYYENGQAVRVYAGGGAIQVEFDNSNDNGTYKVTKIVFGFGSGDGTNGNDNPLTPSIGQFDGTTWTGNASRVKFTIGARSNGTNGGHRRIKTMAITYHLDTSGDVPSGIDPSTNVEAYLGNAISLGGYFVRNPEVYGEWMLSYPRKFAADYGISVHITNPEDVFGCDESSPGCYELTHYPAPNESCPIEEAGWYNIYFRPNRDGGDDWCRGCIKIEHLPQAPDPTNCYEAALFVGQEDENTTYKNGKIYTLEGYVKEIMEAYQDQYHNMSFWISDKANDTYKDVLAFRAACPKASHAVQVGDKVRVTGSLKKFQNNTVEFAKGCTYEILNREEEQGVEETELPESAVKSLENGQLRIERNGIRYNAFGQVVR